jgi:hypothetical protein
LFGLLEDPEFFEASIPYTVDVVLTLDLSTPVDITIPQRPDFYSDLDPTTQSDAWDDSFIGQLTFTRDTYNQAALMEEIVPKVIVEEEEESFLGALGAVFSEYTGASTLLALFVMLCALGVGYVVRNSREDAPLKLAPEAVDAELDA